MNALIVTQYFKQHTNEKSRLEHLFNFRYGKHYTCSKCEREAKLYRIKAERLYSCRW